MCSPIDGNSSNNLTNNPNQPKKKGETLQVFFNTAVKAAELKPSSAAFTPGSSVTSPRIDSYSSLISSQEDGPSGILFSHFINVLKRKIDEAYQTEGFNETSLKNLIENETKKYYPPHSELFIFAALQAWLLVQKDVGNVFLLAFFKNWIFDKEGEVKKESFIERAFYTSLGQKNPLTFLIGVASLANQYSPLPPTLKISRIEGEESLQVLAFPITKNGSTITLEIPFDLNAAHDLLKSHVENPAMFLGFNALLISLFSWPLSSEKRRARTIEDVTFFELTKKLAFQLLLSDLPEFFGLGIQLLTLSDPAKEELEHLETHILENLPSLIFKPVKNPNLLSAIKTLFPNLLEKTDLLSLPCRETSQLTANKSLHLLKSFSIFEEVIDIQFTKEYLKALFKENILKKLQIAFSILKNKLYSFTGFDEVKSYLSFTREHTKILFTSHDPEILDASYLFLKEVAEKFSLHSFSAHFRAYIHFLLEKGQIDKAYLILQECIESEMIKASSDETHALALKICTLSTKTEAHARVSFFFDQAIFGKSSQILSELPAVDAAISSKEFLDRPSLNRFIPPIKQTIHHYLEEGKIDEALLTLQKHLKLFTSEAEFLILFLTTILKEETLSLSQECHKILIFILNLKPCEGVESLKITLLHDHIEKFGLSLDLKMAILKNQDLWLLQKDQKAALTALMALLKIFEPKDLYEKGFKKCSSNWLTVLKLIQDITNDEKILKLKEIILKGEVRHNKEEITPFVREQFLQLFKAFIHLKQSEAFLSLIDYFKTSENILHFFSTSDEFQADFIRCLEFSLEDKSLFNKITPLLQKIIPYKHFHTDLKFVAVFCKIAQTFFERHRYYNFLLLTLQFELYTHAKSGYKKALLSLDPKMFQKHAPLIFQTLVETGQRIDVWNHFFEQAKVSRVAVSEIIGSALIKNHSFLPSLFKGTKEEIYSCFLHFLRSVRKNPEAAYKLLIHMNPFYIFQFCAPKGHLPYPLLLSIYESAFHSLKGKVKEKSELLYIVLSHLEDSQFNEKPAFYHMLSKACIGETDDFLLQINIGPLYKLLSNPRNITLQESLFLFREFFKRWPKHTPVSLTRFFLKGEASDKETARLNQGNPLLELSYCGTFLAGKTATFFEEYENLIQNEYEEIQKIALNFYCHSLANRASLPPKVLKELKPHALLMLAFKSPFSMVFKTALSLFLQPSFLESLSHQELADHSDGIIQKVASLPISYFSDPTDHFHLTFLFLQYIKSRGKKKVNSSYIQYFILWNNHNFHTNTPLFLDFQKNIFTTILNLEEKGNIQVTNNPSYTPPHLLILKNSCELFLNNPSIELLDTICLQFNHFCSLIHGKNILLFRHHFFFIHEEIFGSPLIWQELFKMDLKLTSNLYMNYLKIMASYLNVGEDRVKMIPVCKRIIEGDRELNYSKRIKENSHELYFYILSMFYFSQCLEVYEPEFPINYELFSFLVQNKNNLEEARLGELFSLFNTHYLVLEKTERHKQKIDLFIKQKLYDILCHLEKK